MQAVKAKNTGLERRVFSMLAGMHLSGWKRNPPGVYGKPDVIFQEARIAIFIDGCFWHGCVQCQRKLPETNHDYWERKIQRNIKRDKLIREELSRNGWIVISIWEHEMCNVEDRKKIQLKLRLALSEAADRK